MAGTLGLLSSNLLLLVLGYGWIWKIATMWEADFAKAGTTEQTVRTTQSWLTGIVGIVIPLLQNPGGISSVVLPGSDCHQVQVVS